MIVYGIKNCNTMQKAFAWLEENGIPYTFHDYKKEGITEEKLLQWMTKADLSKLINNKGTTFKKLTPAQQKNILKPEKAVALMMASPSVIKRPILEKGKSLLIGFDPEEWAKQFKVSR